MGQWRLYLPGRRGNENYHGFSQGDGGGGGTRRQRQLTPSVMDEWYLKGREQAHGVRLGGR